MSEELKPCPHCGHTDTWPTGEHGRGLTVNKLTCQHCGASGPRAKDGETAEDAWNRRTVTREQVEAAARSIADGLFFAHGIDAGREHAKDFAIFAFRAAGFDVQELYDLRHILPATISKLKAEA